MPPGCCPSFFSKPLVVSKLKSLKPIIFSLLFSLYISILLLVQELGYLEHMHFLSTVQVELGALQLTLMLDKDKDDELFLGMVHRRKVLCINSSQNHYSGFYHHINLKNAANRI